MMPAPPPRDMPVYSILPTFGPRCPATFRMARKTLASSTASKPDRFSLQYSEMPTRLIVIRFHRLSISP